jgi:hypothetical protein
VLPVVGALHGNVGSRRSRRTEGRVPSAGRHAAYLAGRAAAHGAGWALA